jgi:hypothetical protein
MLTAPTIIADLVNKLPPKDRMHIARILEGVDTRQGVISLANELREGEATSQVLTANQRANIKRRADWLDVIADGMDHTTPSPEEAPC